jgi:hypothetical protein
MLNKPELTYWEFSIDVASQKFILDHVECGISSKLHAKQQSPCQFKEC